MLAALLMASGCWRPDAYEPPPPPFEEVTPPVGDAPEDAPEDVEATERAPTDEAGSAEEAAAAGDEGAEDDESPPFPAYAGRTVQAPVTIVDDWGKPLAVITVPDFPVEVRGEEPVRVRVWCETCKPQAEGWIQAHLVVRAGSSPTNGSK